MMAAKMELKENGESEDYIQWIYKAAVYDFLGKKYEAAIETYRKAIDYYGRHPSENQIRLSRNAVKVSETPFRR